MSVIEFISYGSNHHPDCNPIPLKKITPEWYKKLDKYLGDKNVIFSARHLVNSSATTIPETIKACIPVQDYICSGYVIKSTADLLITQEGLIKDTTSWCWWSANQSLFKCESHSFDQLPLELNNKKQTYIKLTHNIGIKTPKGYSCLFYQPEFLFEKRFKLFPGIVDTDTYNQPINFPGFITSEDKNITIEAGTPLMVVFPFKRESWTHKLTNTENLTSKKFTLEQWYKKFFHSSKSYD